MASVVEGGNEFTNDVLEVESARLAPSNPPVPLPSTMGCWQRPRSSTPVNTSGSWGNLPIRRNFRMRIWPDVNGGVCFVASTCFAWRF
jgi:hypothetical protein